DQQRADASPNQGYESALKLLVGVGLGDDNALASDMRRVLDIPHLTRRRWKAWIDQNPNYDDSRCKVAQEAQPLRLHHRGPPQGHRGGVAAGKVKALNQASADWIAAQRERDRDGRGSLFRGDRAGITSDRGDYRDPSVHEISRECRQAAVVAMRPPELNRD